MRGYQRSRARQPGHMHTARIVAGDLHTERELYTGLPAGPLRDEALERAAGSAAVLHGVLAGVSRPGGASPRDIGVQLTAEQGRPAGDTSAVEYDIVHAAEEYLGKIASAGAGAEIIAEDAIAAGA